MANQRNAIIGSKRNFWLHSTVTGFDLTHPAEPTSPLVHPRLTLEASTATVTIDPQKTALLVIDMQNFFLSPQLGRPTTSNGLKACDALIGNAIPACRKAGIRIVWLNWGLTQEEIDEMPPATLRAFGFETVPHDISSVGHVAIDVDDHDVNTRMSETFQKRPPTAPFGKDPRLYKGLGSEVGRVELDDGQAIDGGRLLMRNQWNSALYSPLERERRPEDGWIYKNRMSGLWGSHSDCSLYLEKEGIRTLLFAGVNTDQCVGGTLQDAFTKGWDCIMLSDACGTTSPSFGQDCVEYNTAKTWGFVIDSEILDRGVNGMQLKEDE